MANGHANTGTPISGLHIAQMHQIGGGREGEGLVQHFWFCTCIGLRAALLIAEWIFNWTASNLAPGSQFLSSRAFYNLDLEMCTTTTNTITTTTTTIVPWSSIVQILTFKTLNLTACRTWNLEIFTNWIVQISRCRNMRSEGCFIPKIREYS